MASRKPVKRGRPPLTPAYVAAIRNTPKGEVVLMGMVDQNDEAFASYQAAAHHQKSIKAALGNSAGRKTVTIVRIPESRVVVEHDESRGRFVERVLDGYYLCLEGRKKVAA